ncbi:ceramide-1-phosphate transfer protein isoform X1 [Dermacentor albipictus]|uniref:ceramide-1-phosphate transfer protein isoform X1 n=1 Tax=Dermacentor albipictus TaxID=60249 RepID=UPI0038FC49AE
MSVFSLKVVIQNLQSCLEDEDDLDMDSYILAYRELSKFFQDLGSLFGFINSDVKSKLDILEDYRKLDDIGDNYETLNTMIEYEKSAGTIEDTKKPSGSRTLLRLHRALEFIAALFKWHVSGAVTAASLSPSEDCVRSMVQSMRRTSLFPSSRIKLSQAVAVLRTISSANDDASVGKMAQESYDRTLAKHHPWLIRKGASLAMLTLPKVDEIFAKALPDEKNDLRQLVSSVSEEAYKVYNFTQTVYEQKNLLNLP